MAKDLVINNGKLDTTKLVGAPNVRQINYILNADAEVDTSGWATYADAAQATPVDGTGGSPQASLWIRSTTSPIRGAGSFRLDKTGSATRQGQGASYNFTIDKADQAKVLTVSFDYEVVSGTYATGDLTVYIYDVTNAQVIQPAGFQVEALGSGVQNKLIATFQTASNSTSYRLILHVASASTQNYTLAFDNVTVGPQTVQYGAPVTDWINFTPTVTVGSGTVPTFSSRIARYRRVGDSIEVRGVLTWQTATTFTSIQIQLPFGRIDSQKQSLTSAVGQTYIRDFGTTNFIGTVRTISSNDQVVECLVNTTDTVSTSTTDPSVGSQITNLIPMTWAVSDELHFVFTVSVTGLGSSVAMSDSTDTRLVSTRISKATQTVLSAADTTLTWDTVGFDTHGAADLANNRIIIKVPGLYQLSLKAFLTSAANEVFTLRIKLNGSTVNSQASSPPTGETGNSIFTACELNLQVGDILTATIQSKTDTNYAVESSVNTFFAVTRISGPSAIAATESVVMRAYKNTGSHTANGAWQAVTSYAANPVDSHGAFNTTTGEYTVPVSGTYQVSSTVGFVANANGFRGLKIRLDGSVTLGGPLIQAVNSVTIGTLISGAGVVKANAGQKISIAAFQSSGGNLGYETGAGYFHFSIVRVGN